MPVDKAQIDAYMDEIGFSPEVRSAVMGDLTSNEQRAVQFVGQRLRHDAFTRKTQDLSTREQEIQNSATNQVADYAKQLGDAQKKIDRIMKDFEEASISSATANSRLRSVKERFQLSDEDIPPVEPATDNKPNSSSQSSIDIDAKLKTFEENLISRLLPDMTAMPMINVIQYDMARQHQELTGKPLSKDEMLDIIRDSAKDKKSLENVWRDKFKIGDLERKRDIDAAIAKDRQEQEVERTRKATEDALAGINNRNSTHQGQAGVLSKSFKPQLDSALPSGSEGNKAIPPPQQHNNGMTGADRAAMKWMERRNKGIPLGEKG